MTTAHFPCVRAVLFDLDGTLIDSAPDLAAAADAMRTERGLPSLPYENYRRVAGTGARGLLSIAFGMATDDPQFPHFREEFFTRYEARIDTSSRFFDGITQLITSLQQQSLAWGIVTNKTSRFTRLLSQRMPLLGSAGTLVSGDSTPYAKPHPQPLLTAAAQLGHAPHECIYVGDDPRDIEAGRAAGMPTVAALYGYLGNGAAPETWGAHASIDSPLALLKLLQLD